MPEGSAAGQPIQGETGHTGLEPNKAAAKGQRVKRGQVTKTGKADWSKDRGVADDFALDNTNTQRL